MLAAEQGEMGVWVSGMHGVLSASAGKGRAEEDKTGEPGEPGGPERCGVEEGEQKRSVREQRTHENHGPMLSPTGPPGDVGLVAAAGEERDVLLL